MALFTDAPFLTALDLTRVDAEVQAVANSEKITLQNVIDQGCEETGNRLLSEIQSFGGSFASLGDVSWNHANALMGYGAQGNQPRAQLGQIVVTNPRPGYLSNVQRLALYHVLALFYRDASSRKSQQVDRYQSKRDDFRTAITRGYWPDLRAAGLPIVLSPLPAPAAVHEPNTGTWIAAASGSGSTAPAGNYDVTITWVGANYVSPTTRNNAESGPSVTQTQLPLTAGQFIRVDIGGLNPPGPASNNNSVPAGYSGYSPTMQALGWNVYAGPSGSVLRLVNPAVLAATSKTYNADPAAATSIALGTGQWPDSSLTFTSSIWRA